MLVQTVLMDIDFDKTMDEMMENTIVNTFAAKEHFSEFERTI